MVTNTNKQDTSEFFLWSDYSPHPRREAAELELGDETPVPALSPNMGRGWGQAHLEQLVLSGSLWLRGREECDEGTPSSSQPPGWAHWGVSGVSGVKQWHWQQLGSEMGQVSKSL